MDSEPENPNEVLVDSLPEVAEGLYDLWGYFAGRKLGFGEEAMPVYRIGPETMAIDWAEKVAWLVDGCHVDIDDALDEDDWGEMIVSLSDLAEELVFYFGPFWETQTVEEQMRSIIRMDMNAQKLFSIFNDRGYLAQDLPFDPMNWG